MSDYFTFTKAEQAYLQEIWNDEESKLSPYAAKSEHALREFDSKYDVDYIRNPYMVDIDKIIHNPMFNRCGDKTQVFSFYRNDDITRRSSHVHLVSRISRIIGHALKLNLDLIEAIAIGHDIGHTPFGHKGEDFLDKLFYENTHYHFTHNVHSVRVLRKIAPSNLTMQTLDGILCHCGEKASSEYKPDTVKDFEVFDTRFNQCMESKEAVKKMHPCTLEGCVVRLSDMIAYIGKDRQDARRARLATDFSESILGENNADILNNVVTNIIKNSIDCDSINMDEEVFDAIIDITKENGIQIYNHPDVIKPYYEVIQPMMENLYKAFLTDIESRQYSSPIFQHHLNDTIFGNCYRNPSSRSIIVNPNFIVADYIASMTDDYFIDIYRYKFPDDTLNDEIRYIEYFEGMNN